jgi:hypothetical protein
VTHRARNIGICTYGSPLISCYLFRLTHVLAYQDGSGQHYFHLNSESSPTPVPHKTKGAFKSNDTQIGIDIWCHENPATWEDKQPFSTEEFGHSSPELRESEMLSFRASPTQITPYRICIWKGKSLHIPLSMNPNKSPPSLSWAAGPPHQPHHRRTIQPIRHQTC